jgi:type IV pilus assembly protein PilY1
LADVAYYYYHNDLRTSAKSNCTGVLGTGHNVCSNDVPGSGVDDGESDFAQFQHMTTYTLGLGISGTLAYDPNYKTLGSGDYYDIKNGTSGTVCGPSNNIACKWPDPGTGSNSKTVDDLWHAAVNGRGLYLSAGNPADLATSLSAALNSMQAVTGAGAGAAAANLAPTTGTTDIYIAQYKTDDWYGDVLAYSFNADTGTVSGTASWQAGPSLDARIGTGGSSDSRTIYVSVDGIRKDFFWANLNAQQKAYFDNTKLSQYSAWDSTQKTAATGDALVNYLRGRYVNEDQTGQTVRLYRDRPHVLGDVIHSQPMYVKESNNTFVTDKTYGGRMGMLYVAANDGMLHAFCTETSGSCTAGKELWAYVVPPVMKNMWYLADKLQQGYHHYFVDGPTAVTDVYFGGSWKTILVGGLGKGGRGFYAMDITVPTDPKLLWTFSAEGKDDKPNTVDDNPNVGYSYGLPLLTKVNGGDWRVLLTSGYNNVPDDPKTGDYANADGGGHVFLLDPATGDLKDTISTGSGSPTAPSGLAQITTHVTNFTVDNSATKAYGGDLNGDMWRFDLVSPTAATKVIGVNSPISTGAAISTVKGYSVLYFGTGRYLGQTDLDDTGPYYIVAVKADKSNLDLSATSKMVDQTAQTAKVDWSKANGWYRTLASTERVAIDPVLYQGTLLVATILPTGTECKPGGTSMLYEIDFGSGIGDGTFFADPIVGLLIIDPPGPAPDPDPQIVVVDATGKVMGGGKLTPPEAEGLTPGTRIMWRELVD